MIDQPFEQHGGAHVVRRCVTLDFVHRLADADLGREVNDAVDPLKRSGDRLSVAHVGLDEFGLKRLRRRRAVDLADQAVEEADTVPAPQQFGCDVAADEPGPPGNQNMFCHAIPIFPDTILMNVIIDLCW